MTAKFKVGDKVRCIDKVCETHDKMLQAGGVYEVEAVTDLNNIRVTVSPYYWSDTRFELVEEYFLLADEELAKHVKRLRKESFEMHEELLRRGYTVEANKGTDDTPKWETLGAYKCSDIRYVKEVTTLKII